MVIKMFDEILLRDGRTAAVVEVLSETAFMVDVGDSERDWDTITVTIDDIERVIRRSSYGN